MLELSEIKLALLPKQQAGFDIKRRRMLQSSKQ